MFAPVFLMRNVKYKKHKKQFVSLENGGEPGYNQDIISHNSNRIYVRPLFLDDNVKYKKHKGQVVSLENGGVHG